MMERLQGWWHVDPLAIVVSGCIVVFTALTLLYSAGYMPRAAGRIRYNAYIVLSLVTALGVVLTHHLLVLLVCWGLSGLLLYLLIGYGSHARTAATAQQTLIIIGGSDAFLLLGIVIIGTLNDTFDMRHMRLSLAQPQAIYAFLSLLIAVVAKAGAMPLHTWLVHTAEDAPTPVTAFLPAAVDKLLAIYLLARMVMHLFSMTPLMQTVLVLIGALTLLAAGMLMLVQQDVKRLLGYCAVSQVGYILLGIGSGQLVGLAGGLFHMINHAIYKSCLFFASGAVEQRAQTTDIERLGGLARQMPLIFSCFTIAALSVAGVPPLNGFASKWLVYQGLIEAAKDGGAVWLLWLIVAMFGSALTLAGMMKLLHAIFLGQAAADRPDMVADGAPTPWVMRIPPLILAALCLLFGIWAGPLTLRHLIGPMVDAAVVVPGLWQPTLATTMLLTGIGLGVLLFLGGRWARTLRQTEVFIGGETLDAVPGLRVSGSAFYNTLLDLPAVGAFYRIALTCNLPHIGSQLTVGMSRILGGLHSGLLPTYIGWCLFGVVMLLVVILFR
jgi:formate hydrogenlyase subunit 3/multisubunit Na+/H+ antiporter MnhD subunit